MNLFVHTCLGHFYMGETDGEGNDLGASTTESEEQEEEESFEQEEESSEEEEEEDGVIVTIGDEDPPAEEEEEKTAPKWVKDLRKQTKEQAKRIRELEQEAAAKAAPATKVPELGPKPTLEDSDWDAEDFEQKLDAWKERKLKIDQAKADEQKQQEAQQKEWQDRLSFYAKGKVDLKARNFDDAESTVMAMFDQTQQGIIIDVMDNPALMVYALGTNPKAAEKLAAIKKPTKFLRELSRMEDKELKVSKKTAPPAPEGKVSSGSARISGSVDSNLERLRAEAEKTGDYSKVTQYRRQQKEKQKA